MERNCGWEAQRYFVIAKQKLRTNLLAGFLSHPEMYRSLILGSENLIYILNFNARNLILSPDLKYSAN